MDPTIYRKLQNYSKCQNLAHEFDDFFKERLFAFHTCGHSKQIIFKFERELKKESFIIIVEAMQ